MTMTTIKSEQMMMPECSKAQDGFICCALNVLLLLVLFLTEPVGLPVSKNISQIFPSKMQRYA